MAVKNSTILNKIWLSGSNDFQQRVPNPSQAGFRASMASILDPTAPQLVFNQFLDGFVNLIGAQVVHDKRWEMPLQRFKRNRLSYGSTIEEAAPAWIKAHAYTNDATDLLKLEQPEFGVWYHRMNRQDKYPISIVRSQIRQAVRDEYGLNRLAQSIISVPFNSDKYDEFNFILETFAEYEANWGFYKHKLSAAPTDEPTGKELLTALRSYAYKFSVPSTLYNAAQGLEIPTFANPSELVWITTADYAASIDVNTLSSVFQLDKAESKYTTVVVPDLPIPNAVGILTTEDFFIIEDVEYTTGSFYDPNTLSTKYILHHWEVISASPFVPAVLFTTDEGTVPPVATVKPSALNIAGDATAHAGDEVQLTLTLNGQIEVDPETADASNVEMAPNAATFEVTAKRNEQPIALNNRTYVDNYGVLHIQKSGLTANDVITVKATSTYYNPSGSTSAITATHTVTIQE